jgi:tellurite resistance protein
LANIYYLARADEQFEVEEDYLLQEIAKDIGAGYLETRKALDMSMADGFKIKFPARLSDRIKNLEDMLLVAYYDKKLHEMEKKIILTYAKHLDITKEQFETIREETKKRLQGRTKV